MATRHQRGLARLMVAPSVLLLLAWLIVPLAMTLWFSFQSYNLLSPGTEQFIGLMNYRFFLSDPPFWAALTNTLLLVGGVIGAQYGAILTTRVKPDYLRLALAVIILLVGLRMFLGLFWHPDEIFSIEYL